MRRPASIKPWLSPEDLQTWVRETRSREEYQKRLAIWLTYLGPFPAPPRCHLAGGLQAGGVALGEPVQSPWAGGSGSRGSRWASLGLSLPRSRSGVSGKFAGGRPARSDPHRPTDSPSTLPSYRQESFARLPLSLAASASLAEVRPPSSSRQGRPGEPGGLQKKLPGLLREALAERPEGMPVRLLFQDEARFGRLSDQRRC